MRIGFILLYLMVVFIDFCILLFLSCISEFIIVRFEIILPFNFSIILWLTNLITYIIRFCLKKIILGLLKLEFILFIVFGIYITLHTSINYITITVCFQFLIQTSTAHGFLWLFKFFKYVSTAYKLSIHIFSLDWNIYVL